MANYSFWALGESQLSISDGGQLDGITQGDGSHLVGLDITLNSYDFEQINVQDRGSDNNFDDNDGNQRLQGSQSFDGATYGNNTRIEAEYRIVLRDRDTGEEYEAVAVNFVNSSPAYGTVEGLAFVDVIPPAGVALEVIEAAEGPRGNGSQSLDNADIAAPACFTPGTLIQTPSGPRLIESLRSGDLVLTWDRGAQPLIWVGQTMMWAADLALCPEARPILICKNAFQDGVPSRDMRVSPQHRVLISGPLAELLFGEPEVLAAAGHLVDGHRIRIDESCQHVVYIHLQCAAHEILISDGLPSESFNPGPDALQSFPPRARRGLTRALPHLSRGRGPTLEAVRPMLKKHEAALWRPPTA